VLLGKDLLPRYRWIVPGVFSLVLLLAACSRSTPAPTPTSTPVRTPTSAPTSTAVPPPTPPAPVTVDLTGKVDATGALTEEVVVTSSDGRAKLTMPKGSVPLNEQGQPLKAITCTALFPPESKEGMVVGWAYAFSDPWTNGTLRPTGSITVSYEPPPANPRIDLTKPQIAGWYEPKKSWVARPAPTTLASPGTVTSRQGYIQTVVVIFWYVDLTPPVS